MIKTLSVSFVSALTIFVSFGLSERSMAEDFTGKAIKPVQEAIELRQQTQQSEDHWAAEKEKLTTRYEALEAHIAVQTTLKDDRSQDLTQHTQTVAVLQKKITEMEKISKEIEPYISEIFKQIKSHISESPPFLKEERERRVAKLGEVIEDRQVKISEKFRRIAETLMIEAEYGSTIEVYPESILLSGKEVQVQIFRLGRLSLFCQSLDKRTTGVYDVATQKWDVLPDKYNSEINTAMEIGAKRRPVDFVNLPIGRISAQ